MKALNGCRICIMLILVMVFTGCVTSTQKLPDFLPADGNKIPGDAQLAATAILIRLNGMEPAPGAGISFEKEAADHLKTPFFSPGKFILTGHRLFQYSRRPDGKPGRLVAGQMDLKDISGRRAKLNYITEYDLTDSGFVILAAEVQPAYATDPTVESYLVPVKAFEKEMTDSPSTWEGLYLLAKRLNVLPVQNNTQGRESKDYILFAFCKDQTAPSAKAVLRLSKKKTTNLNYGYSKDSTYLNFNGWIVATATGTFPAAPEKDFWVKLVLSPGKEAESSRPRIIFQEDLGKMARK
jgi:hypothetical protein